MFDSKCESLKFYPTGCAPFLGKGRVHGRVSASLGRDLVAPAQPLRSVSTSVADAIWASCRLEEAYRLEADLFATPTRASRMLTYRVFLVCAIGMISIEQFGLAAWGNSGTWIEALRPQPAHPFCRVILHSCDARARRGARNI